MESNPDEPTYTVTSELTLTVTRNDNNALIACAVDHASIANGDKRTEQPLSVLCKTHIQKPERLLLCDFRNANQKTFCYYVYTYKIGFSSIDNLILVISCLIHKL